MLASVREGGWGVRARRSQSKYDSSEHFITGCGNRPRNPGSQEGESVTANRAAEPASGRARADQVRTLFGEIAPRYDLLNHLLSLNVDRWWRRRAVRALGWETAPAGTYLDLCSGTFDLALELAGRPGFEGTVLGSDFAFPMLAQGLPKIEDAPVSPVCADSQLLPFATSSFAGITVGFGVRNLSDLQAGLCEAHRALQPGRRLVVAGCDVGSPLAGNPWIIAALSGCVLILNHP